MVDYTYFGPVLFIDDELHIRLSAQQTLELAGFDVTSLERAQDAIEIVKNGWPGIIISDIKMPEMDGLSFMEAVQKIDPDLPIILITGHGDVAMAVQAMRDGAYDFIEKPFASEMLIDVARRAMEKFSLLRENRELKAKLLSKSGIAQHILGKSQTIEDLRSLISNLANADTDVLIKGETGTGKEMVARCLHENSRRKDHHFVALNCGAMPDNIFDSELFGYEPGAFPGTDQRRIGKIEYSHQGTLFLDEIESLPLSLQVKLLRVLQERTIERLGSNRPIKLDLRVVFASKEDLLEKVKEGTFREDLYYRLSVVEIPTPPLRSFKEDIPLLFQFFCQETADRLSRTCPIISDSHVKPLMGHDWPGNMRELKNTADRFVLSDGKHVLEQSVNAEDSTSTETLPQKIESYEKGLIIQALEKTKGSIKDALDVLGIPRKTLSDKMKKYNIERSQFLENKIDN